MSSFFIPDTAPRFSVAAKALNGNIIVTVNTDKRTATILLPKFLNLSFITFPFCLFSGIKKEKIVTSSQVKFMILLFEIACPFTAVTATPAFIALWAVSKIFIIGYFSAFPFICPRFHY